MDHGPPWGKVHRRRRGLTGDVRAGHHAAMEQLAFEEALARLEEIVRRMEQGEVSLEESLALFEQGVALSRHCARKLDEAEQRIATLTRRPDGSIAEDELAATGGAPPEPDPPDDGDDIPF